MSVQEHNSLGRILQKVMKEIVHNRFDEYKGNSKSSRTNQIL